MSSFIPDSHVAQKMTVELRSLGDQLNSDKKEYYLSHVDYLDSVLSKVPQSLSSMTTIIILTIAFAVSLINVILTIRLYNRHAALACLISMIAVPTSAASAPVSQGVTTGKVMAFSLLGYWENYICVLFILVTLVQAMYLLCKLLTFMARNSVFFSPFAVIVRSVLDENKSVLCLVIQNETDSVLLPVKTLNILPHQIVLTSDVLIRSLRMESNCFNMRLCLDWGNTKVMATTVRSPLHLPFSIPVPRVLTKRAMNAIHSPHTCNLVVVRENISYTIPTERSEDMS